MLSYIIKRVLQIIPLFVVVSIISFIIIELPPGDYLTSYVAQLRQAGTEVSEAEIARLEYQYGLNEPAYKRYLAWVSNFFRNGDMGWSFHWERPVTEVIGARLPLTLGITMATLIFTWAVAVPIGIYSATHQYSKLDYAFTFIGFAGLSVPDFLLALVLMWISFSTFDFPVTGLFSLRFYDAPWSVAKVVDLLKHIWVPIVVVGMAGTASLIRIMRGCLLDELQKQYVVTARAKGLSERKVLFRYPVRIAVNPLISSIGWLLPAIISGGTITAVVLNLNLLGPVLLQALLQQDMYLAGSIFLILSMLTLLGTLLSDILLSWVDPRIRFERRDR